jgi:hypothetical protein
MILTRTLLNDADYATWLRDVRTTDRTFECAPPLQYPCMVAYKHYRDYTDHTFSSLQPVFLNMVRHYWIKVYGRLDVGVPHSGYFFVGTLTDLFKQKNFANQKSEI